MGVAPLHLKMDINFTTLLLITLLLMFATWYIRFHFNRRKLYKIASQYNGPTPLPIIGNIHKCLVPLTEITDVILKAALHYKSPARIWLGPYLAIAIWDPENLKIILNNSHALQKQPHLYKLIETATGPGLPTLPVEEWKRHRKLIAPIFNQKYLESVFDVFLTHSKSLVDRICSKADNRIFDVGHYIADYTMDTLVDTIFDFGDEKDVLDGGLIKSFISSMFHALALRMTKMWLLSDFIFKMSTTGRKFIKEKKNYDTLINAVIDKWKDDAKTKVQQPKNHTDEESYKPRKLIEHLLSVSDGKGKFTTEELNGELNNLIVAGIDTLSTSLGFSLIVLGMYPEIQEKMYEEIIQVLDTKKQLECDDLKHLEYTERVIKETLRIFPVTVGIARTNDQEIQLVNHVLPAKSIILIGLPIVHRNPDVWPNPNKFDPDRFLPEEEAKRHPYSWIPFSAGPRNCVGLRYALMSLKIALSTVILNYKVTTDYKNEDDVKLTVNLLIEPTHGYKIGITRRQSMGI